MATSPEKIAKLNKYLREHFYKPLESGNCLGHIGRYIDLYTQYQEAGIADQFDLVLCQGVMANGGMHCWIERQNVAIDLTTMYRDNDGHAYFKDEYRYGMEQVHEYTVGTLYKLIDDDGKSVTFKGLTGRVIEEDSSRVVVTC